MNPPRMLIGLILLVPIFWLGATATRSVAALRSAATWSSLAPLVRQPFLQRVSDTSATVVWASQEAGPGEVRYHAEGDSDTTVLAATTFYGSAYTGMSVDYYQHEATLNGLQPATTYTYTLLVQGQVASSSTDLLTTAPARGTGTVRFVAFGDSGGGGTPQRQIAGLIAADSAANQFDLAIHTGDVVYPKGTFPLLQDRFFDVYEEWLRRRPIFLAIGNHEEYAAGGRPYLDVFVLPENGASVRYPDHRERYYSFDYGPVHFIALDTQLAFTAGSRRDEQMAWLVRDLEATTQPWRIVFFHRPAYGSSDLSTSFDVRDALRPIFERYGVQLVLAGHEHVYSRGAPWREGPASNSPVAYVVTGGGGAGLNKPEPGLWTVGWAGVYHYLRVNVTDCMPANSCELSLEAVGTDGAVFDSFTLPLRAQQNDTAPPQVAWVQPAAGDVVSGTVTVSGDATDDSQIVKLDLLVDGELRRVDGAAPYEWSWDTTRELNGDCELELRATDLAGHQTTSDARVLRVSNPRPTVRLLSPFGSDIAFTGLPYRIRWAAGAGKNLLNGFHAEVSANGGRTFASVAECATLAADARECVWSTPGPISNRAVVRVTAVDTTGQEASDTSDPFRVKSGTTTLVLKRPDKPTALGLGSRQSIFWSSALGLGATLSVDVSRDGGSSWSALAPSLVNRTQDLRWMVTEPSTTQGLIRVTSLNSPLEDVSSGFFTIREAQLALAGPTASTVWTANTQVKVKWTSNLGVYDRLNLRLSTDGGSTFSLLLAADVPATNHVVTITVPAVTSSAARLLIESVEHRDWRAMNPANFTIQ